MDWFKRLQEYLEMDCADYDCDGLGSFGCEKKCRVEEGRENAQQHIIESSIQPVKE